MVLLDFFIKGIGVFDFLMYLNYCEMIWIHVYAQVNIFNIRSVDFLLIHFITINNLSLIHVNAAKYLFVILPSLLLLGIFILALKSLKHDSEELELQSVFLSGINNEDFTNDLIIRNKVYMSKEKESAILAVLIGYEEANFFLKKDISLNQLALDSGINEKYIGYIIKKYRGKDFPTYINELRVSYIVECLKVNPVYLEYKISYLASQCGFTSHSGFSITFKKVVGISPSVFISDLKKKSLEVYL